LRIPRPHAAGVALFALVTCSALVRVRVNHGFQGPQLYCDEYIYAGIARNFATTGHLHYEEGPAGGGALLYPILIAPAWLAHTMATVVGLVKLINATLISLTAVPVYLWARRMVSQWWALVAAALVLLMAPVVLSGMLMSESVALPAFTLAVFAIGLAIEDPTPRRQGLLAVTLVLAYGTRAQGLVLLAILPTALLLDVVLELRTGVPRGQVKRRVWRFAPFAAVMGIAVLGYLARSHFSPGRAVGLYHRVATTHYDPISVLLWTARHAGDAVLALGVAPFCALLLLFFRALTGKLEGRAERAFVATAVAAVFCFLLQVGMYASAFNPQILERYAMYAFPPLLIALAVCLGQGLQRPLVETVAAVLCSLALAAFIIFGAFVRPERDPSGTVFASLTLHFFTRIPQHVPGGLGVARLTLFLFAAGVAVFFAIARTRFARVLLPVALGLFLVLASRSAHVVLAANTYNSVGATGPVRSWIDDRIGSSPNRAAYLDIRRNPSLWTSSTVLVTTQFWNRSIDPVYTLGAAPLCPLPLKTLRLDEQTGAFVDEHDRRPAREPYVVAESGVEVAGKPVASGGSPSAPLTIYRPAQPLRLTSRLVGVYPDGWTGPDASYFVYPSSPPRPDKIDISLSRVGWTGPDVPGRVTVTVRGLAAASKRPSIVKRRWVAHSGGSTVLRLQAPAPPFEVSVHVAPTFSPARFGLGDPRQLGVQLQLSLVGSPRRHG
jgi:hypothetical protein